MNEKISIREYARRKQVSDTAVRKAIKAGKIVKGVVKDARGNPFIIEEIADQEWRQNHNPSYFKTTLSGKALFDEGDTKEQTPVAPKGSGNPKPGSVPVSAPATAPPAAPASTNESTFAAAKKAKAVYDAKLAELEYKKKAGNLVDRNEVYKALYGAGQEMRSAFTSIPDRVIDNLLACKSRHEAHQLLTDAIYEALEVFTNIEKRDITQNR